MLSSLLIGFICLCMVAALLFFLLRGPGHRVWILVVALGALLSLAIPAILDATGNVYAAVAICAAGAFGLLAAGVIASAHMGKLRAQAEESPRPLLRYPSVLAKRLAADGVFSLSGGDEADEGWMDAPDGPFVYDEIPYQDAERYRELMIDLDEDEISMDVEEDIPGIVTAVMTAIEPVDELSEAMEQETAVLLATEAEPEIVAEPEVDAEPELVVEPRADELKKRAYSLVLEKKWSEAADAFFVLRDYTGDPELKKHADFERLDALIQAGSQYEAIDLIFSILEFGYELTEDERENVVAILRRLEQ